MTRTPTAARFPGSIRQVVSGLLIIFLAWHVFASFLWIAPPTPLREVVPGTLLQSYMIPWFGQSWSVFAPEPINGDNEILIRAELRPAGESSVTAWINATDIEYQLAYHNLVPPKAATMGMHQAADFRNVWTKLNAEQQASVTRDLGQDADLKAVLTDEDGRLTEAARAYIAQEERTRAYATEVAYAVWGSRVTAVQYLVQRHPIVPFQSRNDSTIERPDAIQYVTGWRAPSSTFDASDESFRKTFLDAWRSYKERNK